MVSKGLRVRRGLRDPRAIPVTLDLRVPMVSKGLRVRRGLRDPRAIPVTLDLRVPMVSKGLRVRWGLRDRVARLMVRHAQMRPALLEPWCQVPTPRVCFLRTA